MAAILDGQFAKIGIVFLDDRSGTMLYRIHSESHEKYHFLVFADFSNGSRRPSF